MTSEEAIGILDPDAKTVWKAYDGKDIERCNEACRLAVKALELQIPKKPEADYYTGKYICPNCHNEVAYSVDDFGNFCSVCGQAIQKEG